MSLVKRTSFFLIIWCCYFSITFLYMVKSTATIVSILKSNCILLAAGCLADKYNRVQLRTLKIEIIKFHLTGDVVANYGNAINYRIFHSNGAGFVLKFQMYRLLRFSCSRSFLYGTTLSTSNLFFSDYTAPVIILFYPRDIVNSRFY